MVFSDFQTEKKLRSYSVLVEVVQKVSSTGKNNSPCSRNPQSTVGCQCESLHRRVSMRGGRVGVGSAQRTRSAPPVELQQGSGVRGRSNNSAHRGGGPSLKPAAEVGGEGSAQWCAFPLQTAPAREQKMPFSPISASHCWSNQYFPSVILTLIFAHRCKILVQL